MKKDGREVEIMRFMDNLRYRLTRFLYGRYGVDSLGRFLSIVITILLIISIFWRNLIVTALALVLLVWMYFRVLSKHYDARRKENAAYLKVSRPFRRAFSMMYLRIRDGKTHRYYSCPHCHQRLRVPKGKGKITITCPKCATRFDAKS